ncbi:MAG: Hsp70 family protein, partial [Lachnospiraceae bacterium]|nr:Hsp70 family protein [Lachnospiraceae bacterium]
INKAVREAAEFEAQDKARKEAIDARNEADALAVQVEKALNEAGDKLDPADKTEVENDLSTLKALIGTDASVELTPEQVNSIKSAKEKLLASSQKVFTKMYEQAQANYQQAGGPQPGPDMGQQAGPQPGSQPGPEGDVVDGDYKEI